jgi:uncharacterized protein YndB with AHSA1/START domain
VGLRPCLPEPGLREESLAARHSPRYRPVMRASPLVFRRLFIAAMAIASATAAGAFFLPGSIDFEDTVTIKAPRAAVWDQLADLRRWEEWGPWFRRGSLVDTRYDGTPGERGQLMTWSSRTEGTGRIKTVAARAEESIQFAADFGDAGDAGYTLMLTQADPATTVVHCRFHSSASQNLSRRYFGLLARPRLRTLLREGLHGLRSHCEEAPASPP